MSRDRRKDGKPKGRNKRPSGGAGPAARGGSPRERGRPAAAPVARTESAVYEAEALPGLAPFVEAEIVSGGARVLHRDEGAVVFAYEGDAAGLRRLRTATAVYRALRFEVPRPRALLGHEHIKRLSGLIDALGGASVYRGFRFSAAGSDSPAFSRLARALEEMTGMPHDDEGELLLRFRPTPQGGWEVLARLTPRPLSARPWRVCNRPGGLNAAVAAAALRILGTSGRDRFLNLMCGSGTLIVERALAGPWQVGVGVDLDREAVECAARNLAEAGVDRRAELLEADATALPFPAGSFDRLCADLPWGDAVGRHSDNARLYPLFLAEAARVAAPRARLMVITHELRLFEVALEEQDDWRIDGSPTRVFHGGHRPGLYLLERRSRSRGGESRPRRG